MTKHMVTVDGQTIDAGSAEAAALIEQLRDQIANDNQARQAVLAGKDREISETQAQIDQLRQQADGQHKLIIALGDLKALCQSRLKVDAVGRTVVDMMRDALGKKLGPQAVVGKDDAYIAARFDMVLDSAAMAAPQLDPFRQAALNGFTTNDGNTADGAHKKMIADMTGAWQRPAPDDESLN